MYSDENKPSALALILNHYDYVVLDTCSLMEDSFTEWLDTLSRSKEYWNEGLQIYVPEACMVELKKHAEDKSKENIAKRVAAKRALKIVNRALGAIWPNRWRKVLTLLKDETEPTFADNQIYNFVNRYRMNKSILVITQDKTLAYELREQNHLVSQKGRLVDVSKITDKGDLITNKGEKPLDRNRGQRPQKPMQKASEDNNKGFRKPEGRRNEDPIVRNDMRLSCNLDNPNYPAKRKVSDIKEQISLLKALPSDKLSKMSLAFTLEDLEKRIKGLGPVEEESKPVEAKKVEPKSEQSKKEDRSSFKSDRPKALGSGKTVYDAVKSYCNARGVIVRDDSVPYVAMVHGPSDITESVLKDFVSKVPANERIDFTGAIAGLPIALRSGGKYIDAYNPVALLNEAKPAVVQSPKAPQKAEQPKAMEVKKAVETKAEQPKAPVAKKTEQPKAKPENPEPKPQKAEKKVVIKNGEDIEVKGSNRKEVQATPRAVVPKGATLIVGVPESPRVAAAIEKKSKRLDTPKTTEVVKPATAKRGPKPKADSSLLQEAKKADIRLQANLNNPTFPAESAIKDIDAQLTRLHQLTPYERSSLKLGLRELKNRKTEIQNKKA